jgi:hypothetical protein
MNRVSRGRGGIRWLAAAVVAATAASMALVAGITNASASPSATADPTFAVVNGPVYAMVHAGSRIYVGGRFTWAGAYTGGGVPVTDTDGLRRADSRVIEGSVHAAVPDGAGGWVLGGTFYKTGGYFRNNAALMLPDGRFSGTWNPNVKGGPVTEVAVGGGAAYLGGTFTTVSGVNRAGLAKVDLATGALQNWTPGTSGSVTALAVSANGATVYVGTTTGLEAFDAITGTARPVPGINGAVHTLGASGDGALLYLGGSFSAVGGAARANLAAIDTSTAAPTAWAPAADGEVRTLALRGTDVYVGGAFSTLAGSARARLGRVRTDGSLAGWAPTVGDPAGGPVAVNTLAVSTDGTSVFAGGTFTRAGGQPRHRAAAFSASLASVTAWQPSADAEVQTVAVAGTRILVGGLFNMLNGVPRTNLAALDATTGQVDRGFVASANNDVRALAATLDGSRLFVGGDFSRINDVVRRTVGAVDGATGALVADWQADTDGVVRALAVSGDRVYVGGPFTTIGGTPRTRLALLSAATGAVDPGFVPNVNDGVRALVASPDGATLFLGGRFNRVDAAIRPGIAAVDAFSGRVRPFAPVEGGVVIALGLSPDGSRLYASGETNRTYAYDHATSNTARWILRTGGDVQAIAASTTEVYVGGHFTTLPEAKVSRPHLASVSADTGAATAWNPAPDGWFWGVWAITPVPGGLAIAGEFTKVGTDTRNNLALLPGTI